MDVIGTVVQFNVKKQFGFVSVAGISSDLRIEWWRQRRTFLAVTTRHPRVVFFTGSGYAVPQAGDEVVVRLCEKNGEVAVTLWGLKRDWDVAAREVERVARVAVEEPPRSVIPAVLDVAEDVGVAVASPPSTLLATPMIARELPPLPPRPIASSLPVSPLTYEEMVEVLGEPFAEHLQKALSAHEVTLTEATLFVRSPMKRKKGKAIIAYRVWQQAQKNRKEATLPAFVQHVLSQNGIHG